MEGAITVQSGIILAALVAVVWWLLRRFDTRIDEVRERADRMVAEERASRDRAQSEDRKLFMDAHERATRTFLDMIDKERDSAKADRHDFRTDLQALTVSLHAYKLESAEKFVNRAHLAEAIAPLRDVVEGLRRDFRDVYEKLDGKADKSARPAGH